MTAHCAKFERFNGQPGLVVFLRVCRWLRANCRRLVQDLWDTHEDEPVWRSTNGRITPRRPRMVFKPGFDRFVRLSHAFPFLAEDTTISHTDCAHLVWLCSMHSRRLPTTRCKYMYINIFSCNLHASPFLTPWGASQPLAKDLQCIIAGHRIAGITAAAQRAVPHVENAPSAGGFECYLWNAFLLLYSVKFTVTLLVNLMHFGCTICRRAYCPGQAWNKHRSIHARFENFERRVSIKIPIQ